MKWVKVAIGAVIAIAVVPMIALSVFNLTQETTKEEVVTFEVLTSSTVTSGTYNLLNEYLVNTSTNIEITFIFNDITYNGEYRYNNVSNLIEFYFDESNIDYVFIYDNDTWLQEDPVNITLDVNDTFVFTFEVTQPPVLSGVTATLLLLAPVIFVSGILYFIYNNKQEGI